MTYFSRSEQLYWLFETLRPIWKISSDGSVTAYGERENRTSGAKCSPKESALSVGA